MKPTPVILIAVVLVVLAAAKVIEAQPVQPAPGQYGDDVVLSLDPGVGDLEYRFITDGRNGDTRYYLPWQGPILLSAPNGTQVTYRLQIRAVDADEPVDGFETDSHNEPIYSWTIDKLSPDAPVPQPLPGVYADERAVSAATTDPDEAVWVQEVDRDATFRPLDGEGVQLVGGPGELSDHTLAFQARDDAGNRGPIAAYRYRIDRRGESSGDGPLILSPVAGTFANRQLVVLDDRRYRVMRATVAESGSGRVQSVSAATPELVPGSGDFTLTVTAIRRRDQTEVSERVSWRQQPVDSPFADLPAGRVSEPVTIPAPEPAVRYTLEDRPVTQSDPLLSGPLTIAPIPDVLRVVSLRLRPVGATTEFRSVLLMEGRVPPEPVVEQIGDAVVVFSDSESDVVYVAQDGPSMRESPPRDALPASGTIEVAALGGSVVNAWARYPGGAWSAPGSGTVESVAGPTPIDVTPDRATGRVTITPQRAGRFRLVAGDGIEVMRGFGGAPIVWDVPQGIAASVSAGGADVAPVRVDTAPPAPPEIVWDGERIGVTGSGARYLRLNDEPFERYRAPLPLPGEPAALVTYRVEAYRVVDGRRSTSAVRLVRRDRRELAVPPLVEPLPRFSSNAELELVFANPHSDLVVHYEVAADGDSPPVPNLESPTTRSSIVLETPQGTQRVYRVAARARYEGRDEWSSLQRYSVIVDRIAPDPPRLLSPSGDVTAAEPQVIRFAEPERGADLLYRLSPDAAFEPWAGPVTVGGGGTTDESYVVEAYTRDAAGNRSDLARPVRITIRTERPRPPAITVDSVPVEAPSITAAQDLVVGVKPELENSSVMWRVRPATAAADQPFEPFNGDQTLPVGDDPPRSRVIVEAYAVNDAGVPSELSRLLVVLDRSAPSPPAAPYITRTAPDGRSGVASWASQANETIYAAQTTDGTDPPPIGSPAYAAVGESYRWTIPQGRESVQLAWYAVDPAGNASGLSRIRLDATPQAQPPRFSGAEDGAVYADAREIAIAADSIVRFSVSTTGEPAPNVHPLSTVYRAPLRFAAADGEVLQVQLRARSDAGDGRLSDERHIAFTIDRRPPPSPSLSGASNEAYYAETRVVTLSSSEPDATIQYRVVREADDAQEPEFAPYAGPVELPAVAGELVTYRIEAYTTDVADNRSDETVSWRIHIDQEIVYVDGSTAAPGDGSRDSPYGSLADALTAAARDARTTVFLSAGRFTLEAAALSAFSGGPLALVGGFTSGDWTGQSGVTIVTIAGGTALEVPGGTELQDLSIEGAVRLLAAPDAETRLVRVEIAAGPEHPALELTGGAAIRARTVALTGARGDLRLAPGSSADFENLVATDVVAQSATLRLTDATVERMRIDARSDLVAQRLALTSRQRDGSALEIRGSEASITDSVIRFASPDGSSPAITAVDAIVSLIDTTVVSMSRETAIALRQRGGTARIDSAFLSATSEAALAATMVLRGVDAAVVNSALVARGRPESVGVILADGTLQVDYSVVHLGGADGVLMEAINATGTATRVAVTNSLVSSAAGRDSAAIRLDPLVDASVRTSAFSGFGRPMARSAPRGRWTASQRDAEITFGGASGNIAASFDGSVPDVDGEAAADELIEQLAGRWGARLASPDPHIPVDAAGRERDPLRPDAGPIELPR